MKYNIGKINQIGKMLAEVVEEAIQAEGKKEVLIGDVEMAMREGLREIGQQALKCFLESADGEAEVISHLLLLNSSNPFLAFSSSASSRQLEGIFNFFSSKGFPTRI